MRELTPAIGRCTALTWLSLNANKLQQLPPEIGQLTNLSRL
jgi:Leucine-rich repeat (LRR) protein